MFKQVSKSSAYLASQVTSVATLTDSALTACANGAVLLEIATTRAVVESLQEAGMSLEDLFNHRAALRDASMRQHSTKPIAAANAA